jgi:glycosyltransferase involved in cell wall biosynthesis
VKLAVFYDFLDTIGGGERVALTLAKQFDADLVTTNVDPTLSTRTGFTNVNVINLGPLRSRPPLKQFDAARKFGQARFPDYDFYLILGNWAIYASRHHHPNLYYCLTPTRMFYDQRKAVLQRVGPMARLAARLWIGFQRPSDRRAVAHADRIVAISQNVRRRIARYYGRDADVVCPPVATSRFRFQEVGDTWLSVGRLYPEKRIDLLFEIFRRLPREKLILVGGHSVGDRAAKYLAHLEAPPNVTMMGEITDEALLDLYATCRGLITAAVDEDFGITPVEAMAAGKAVLATDEGGYRETVVDGKTGFLLPPDAGAFAGKIRELDSSTLRSMRGACIARAQAFDESVFMQRMRALVSSATA